MGSNTAGIQEKLLTEVNLTPDKAFKTGRETEREKEKKKKFPRRRQNKTRKTQNAKIHKGKYSSSKWGRCEGDHIKSDVCLAIGKTRLKCVRQICPCVEQKLRVDTVGSNTNGTYTDRGIGYHGEPSGEN